MKRTLLNSTAVLTALLTTAPAFAADQARRGPHSETAARSAHAQSAPRVAEGRAVPRGQAVAPVQVAPNLVRPAVVAPVRPAVVAPGVRPTVVAPVRPYVAQPYVARPYYAPRAYYAPYPYYARPYYARPYYARPYYSGPYVFRPHFSIGFGIWAGYPIPYAYAYPYPVPVYGYGAPAAAVSVGPSSTQYGGVALEITPGDATVYVDGGYAGLVRDFDGTKQTLTLGPGHHRVEISAPGFETMTFDVDTVPGQIVPYRGDLQPLR
ncbi:MAG TPA: PEGA domain-containing protein [Vicinamibacterales bacterium]